MSTADSSRTVGRRLLGVLAVLLVCAAIVSSLFRALTPWASQYRGEVEQRLSTWIGEPVTIGAMETGWYWFHPVLKLKDIRLSSRKSGMMSVDRLLVGINLFRSLWYWQIQPGVVFLEGARLSMTQHANGFAFSGMQDAVSMGSQNHEPLLQWLLQQRKIVVKDVTLRIHLEDGTLLPVRDLRFVAVNRDGHYSVRASGDLAQTTPTSLRLSGDLHINPWALSRARGQWYVEMDNVLPAQWQGLWGSRLLHVDAGEGDAKVWIDMAKGQLAAVQATIRMHNLAWTEPQTMQSALFQTLKANLALKRKDNAWELLADHVRMRVNGNRWPENALKYQLHDTGRQQLYVRNLNLQALLATAFPWPESLDPLLAMYPQGVLRDTEIIWQDHTLIAVLSRFTGLGWQPSDRIPGVHNLSGAIAWQPGEGRFELDTEKGQFQMPGQAPLMVSVLNAQWDWKQLANGLRISMDRLVVQGDDATLTAQGLLDGANLSEGTGKLQLQGALSAKGAQRWLPLLPDAPLKPKLAQWLKHDISRISSVTARFRAEGNLADFPFDHDNGIFEINGNLEGLDLAFDKDWPPVTDIDTSIRVSGRVLEANVSHAKHATLEVNQANVRAINLGLGREFLLIRAMLETPAANGLAWLEKTPLAKPLVKLRQVKAAGDLGVSVALEVPLYPENNTILVRGDVRFSGNPVTVDHALHKVRLKHVQGVLHFNEQGLEPSRLDAEVLSAPVAITLGSRKDPAPLTEIAMEGDISVARLREAFGAPLLEFMEGAMHLGMMLTMTDNPDDFDAIHFESSLEGTAVNLPQPFGKSRASKRLVTVDLDYNPEKAVHLRFGDSQSVAGDLLFTKGSKGFGLRKGGMAFGSATAPKPDIDGLMVNVRLATLDLDRWMPIVSRLKGDGDAATDFLPDKLVFRANRVVLRGREYPDFSLFGRKRRPGLWSFHTESPSLRGDFSWESVSNHLNVRIQELTLEKPRPADHKSLSGKTLSLNPKAIPNLDLQIDSLRVGKTALGELTLHGKQVPNGFSVDAAKLEAPAYTLSGRGDWTADDNAKQQSRVESTLKIRDLGAILSRNGEPAPVVAKGGEARFAVSWPGGFTDYATNTLNGQLWIHVKNGRITHLSQDAENKMDLGRILSILSLQTIPRRLKLDFSDLSKDGYSFDVFDGNFTLKNGVMETTDAYIDGPVVYAAIRGSVDLGRETSDLHLRIAPHITASLPIVATIAGGPIAGVAAWVVSKVVNAGMEKVSGYTYKVSGPWKDPIIQQTSITTAARKEKA